MHGGWEESVFPRRYQLGEVLGKGGGGQVWAAYDQATGLDVAIKALHANYQPAEADALIRETIALSGLEGLGFPRLLQLGRAVDGRLFLVRELVEGQSFDQVQQSEPRRALSLLFSVACVLTVVHQAGLLHGDVKPANLIVRPLGQVALVDLGLATALREGGEESVGLTPHFAAPEVRAGGPLTVQGEVYSLGVMLSDLLDDGADAELSAGASDELQKLAARAKSEAPEARFPSADEFAQALFAALGGDVVPYERAGPPWPVKGLEGPAYQLKKAIEALAPGSTYRLRAPRGCGASTLLRRVAWDAALRGEAVSLVDEQVLALGSWKSEMGSEHAAGRLIIFDSLGSEHDELLDELAQAGARIVRTVGVDEPCDGEVPALEMAVIVELFRGALPAMPAELIGHLVARLGALPGPLRRFVALAEGFPVINASDIDRVLFGTSLEQQCAPDLVERALDRGHYGSVASVVAGLDSADPRQAWLRARFELAAGSSEDALGFCRQALSAEPRADLRERVLATEARAHLGRGDYQQALDGLANLESWQAEARAEGFAYRGLAQTLLGDCAQATSSLEQGLKAAAESGSPRLAALVGSSLATAQWRAGDTTAAIESYRGAIEAAREVGDSGMLASSQINLAGLMKERGDLALSIELLEGAVDAARRAGRRSSLQQALLNLTNTDLYLGRLERARVQIARVGDQAKLPPALGAQFHGLMGELLARQGAIEDALKEFAACRQAWEDLARRPDAAEAALEAVLVAADRPKGERSKGQFVPSEKLLSNLLAHGERLLAGEENALFLLAKARVQYLTGNEAKAEETAQKARALAVRRIGANGHGEQPPWKLRFWRRRANAPRQLELPNWQWKRWKTSARDFQKSFARCTGASHDAGRCARAAEVNRCFFLRRKRAELLMMT